MTKYLKKGHMSISIRVNRILTKKIMRKEPKTQPMRKNTINKCMINGKTKLNLKSIFNKKTMIT